MDLLSLISWLMAAGYLGLGLHALRLDARSRLNRIFFAMFCSLCAWAIGFGLAIRQDAVEQVWFWYRVQGLGWALLPALLLRFLAALTGDEARRPMRWLLGLALAAGLSFFLRGWTGQVLVTGFVRTPLGWDEVFGPIGPWGVAYLVYYNACTMGGLYLTYRWGRTDARARARARTIVNTGLPTMAVITANNIVMRLLDLHPFPGLAPLVASLWVGGMAFAVIRHQLLAITPAVAAEQILRTMSDALLLLGPGGVVAAANPAAEALFEGTSLVGRGAAELLQLSALPPAGEGGGPIPASHELRHRMSHGEERFLMVSTSAVEDTRGVPVGTVAILRDITQRKRAEDELHRSAQELRELAELLPGAIFQLDAGGRITFANQHLSRLAGTDLKQPAAAPIFFDLLVEADTARARRDFGRVLSGETLESVEYELRRQDGSRCPIGAYCSPVMHDERIVGLRGIAIDLTERKQLEERLLHAVKMQAIGQLAGGVAHDFNNLLAVILSYADVLAAESAPGTVGEEAGANIRAAALRAAALTRQLLGFARQGKFEASAIDVHVLVGEAVGLLSRTLDKNIRLTTELRASEHHALGDATQLHQVVMNLALNARDAMPAGGELRLTTDTVELAEEDCRRHPGLQAGHHLKLSVIDSGSGIPAAVRDRIFEPFFTTKPRGQGTGMGLATAYGIVKHHGGSIAFTSSDRGTTFEVLLPTIDPRTARRGTPPGSPTVGKGKILVVDDEPMVLRSTTRILRTLGYEVLTAESGARALEVVGVERHAIDLVLLDLQMPGMSGSECFRALREIMPGVRVLLCSGYASEEISQTLIAQGAIGFLQKPYEVKTVAERVHAALTPP